MGDTETDSQYGAQLYLIHVMSSVWIKHFAFFFVFFSILGLGMWRTGSEGKTAKTTTMGTKTGRKTSKGL